MTSQRASHPDQCSALGGPGRTSTTDPQASEAQGCQVAFDEKPASRGLISLILILIFLISACRGVQGAPAFQDEAPIFIPPSPQSAPVHPTTFPTSNPAARTPPPTLPPSPQPAATKFAEDDVFSQDPSLPRSRYLLVAELDYNAHRIAASEQLTYVNRSGESLTEIVLLVEPNRYSGAFKIEALNWADGRLVEGYELDEGVLRIPLPDPLPPWQSLGLQLEFNLILPFRGGTFGYTERQTNLGDWYPFIPLYRPGSGWLVHSPSGAGIGEYLTYDIADYQVEFRLASPPPGLIVASSAPGEASGDTYRYNVQAIRSFVLSISPDYEVIQDETGAVPVSVYVFPEHLTAGEAALAASRDAFDLYRIKFGEIPRIALTVVEGEFADGMEYDGLYFLSWSYFDTFFGGPQNFLTTLAAHETSHQWWYGLVANDQAIEPWLDEALATFSERIYFEEYYPSLVEWWREFRIDLYEPDGWVDGTIYDYDGFRPYVNAVYLRGAEFLQEVREQMGDESFFKALQAYLIENSYADGTTEELLNQFEELAGKPIDSQVREYFNNPP